MLGPQISISNNPTLNFFIAKHKAIYVATVLFPTPPLPDKTRILCFILLSFSFILTRS